MVFHSVHASTFNRERVCELSKLADANVAKVARDRYCVRTPGQDAKICHRIYKAVFGEPAEFPTQVELEAMCEPAASRKAAEPFDDIEADL